MKTAVFFAFIFLTPIVALGGEIVVFDPVDEVTEEQIRNYFYGYIYLMSRGPSEPHMIKAEPLTEPLKPRQVKPFDWHGHRCLRVSFWAVETQKKCLIESILVGRGGTMSVASSWLIKPRVIFGAAEMRGAPFHIDKVQWVDSKTVELIDTQDFYDIINNTEIKGPRIILLKEKSEGEFEVTSVSVGTVVSKQEKKK